MSTYDTFDDDALAKFINDFIDGMPAHRRGYPDTYARRMAEGIRGLLSAEAAEQGEGTARPRKVVAEHLSVIPSGLSDYTPVSCARCGAYPLGRDGFTIQT